jgi:hypothetical protein
MIWEAFCAMFKDWCAAQEAAMACVEEDLERARAQLAKEQSP